MFLLRILKKWFGREAFYAKGGYRELISIAYPLILMSASNIIMQFADRKFLGNSSTEEMAAALPGGVLFFTLFCFFSATVNFTSAIVAQFHGAGKPRECVSAVWNGFYFALAASVVIGGAVPFIGYVIIHNTVAPELAGLAWIYFYSLVPSGIFACCSGPFFAFFSGRGRTLPVALINISICLLNLFLNWLLIFGNWGLPRWGIFGAGVATSLSAGIGFLAIFSLYFFFIRQDVHPTRSCRRFRFDYVKRLLRFGSPAGLHVFSDVGCFTLIILIVGHLGPVSTAAMTIAFSINNLSFMPLTGVSDATAILCGQYIGRRQKKLAAQIPYRSWRLALIWISVTAVFYITIPEWLASTFRPDEAGSIDFSEVVAMSALVLFVAAVWNYADTIKFVFGGALRGAGDTRSIMIINTCCCWGLVVPGIALLVLLFKVHVAWVWVYLAVCTGFEGLLVYLRFRSGAWRKIRLVRTERDALAGVPLDEIEQLPL